MISEMFKVATIYYIGIVIIIWTNNTFIKNKLDDLERKINSLLEEKDKKSAYGTKTEIRKNIF